MPDLISDGGTMTVGRRTANWTWGQFEVTLQEGLQQGVPEDDRLVDGYIYRPDDVRTGRAELTFVRADVRVDMNLEKSDLEATLDQASQRTEGDIFYSRSIKGLGLGRKRPGVDYSLGSILDVMVWAQVMELPVTGIRNISTPDDPVGYEVQVGGQMISDPEAMRKRYDERAAEIAAEKRQRLRAVENMRVSAAAATTTVNGRVDELTLALTGSVNGDLAEAVADHAGIAGQLMEKAEQFGLWSVEKQEDLNWAFALSQDYQATLNETNLIAWTTQSEYNERKNEIDAAQDDLIAANRQMSERLEMAVEQLSAVTALVVGQTHASVSHVVQPLTVPFDDYAMLFSFTAAVAVSYNMDFWVGWRNADRGSVYEISVDKNGTELFYLWSDSIGPTSFLGDGYREQSMTQTVSMAPGDTLTFWAYSDASGTASRLISDGGVHMTQRL